MPREGHDPDWEDSPGAQLISIHVPREGHDCGILGWIKTTKEFQSTCPARGTTLYIPAETGERIISIHVPREGHDR